MTSSSTSLSAAEIEFTNAFNAQRVTLAAFAKCANEEELHVVRDGFYLGLANDLCPDEYRPVQMAIVMDADFKLANAAGTAKAFQQTIVSARKATDEWETLVQAVKQKAELAGCSNLESIWMGLENGRLEWLSAASAAHGIKIIMKAALVKDLQDTSTGTGTGTIEHVKPAEGDVSDAKMVWIYALCLNVPALEEEVAVWQRAVGIKDKAMPLVDYNSELWDCRKKEWAPLDLGAQALAERGGSSIEEAWNLL